MEQIKEFNEEITNFPGNVSPLRQKGYVKESLLESYALMRKRELVASFSDSISCKLRNAYGVKLLAEPNLENCNCKDWIKNFQKAWKNCSSRAEKIRILTLLPDGLSKSTILSNFPEVTMYMFDKTRNLVKNEDKGIYSKPDVYMGHPLSECVKQLALDYFLNDDFNCSQQSPNKNDVITVVENGMKVKRVKRFLTRSIKESFELFRKENPEKQISRSLRPKYVLRNSPKEVCLCIYCANFDLYLIGLKNFRQENQSEMEKIRMAVLSAIMCHPSSEPCIFQECESGPGKKAITPELLKLEDVDDSEEITFATWDKGDLQNKTFNIALFIDELATWSMKVNLHNQLKDVQRKAIKEEKICAKSNSQHLLMHADFAENWTVILKKAIQGNHLINKQISIFTAVCYQGNMTTSFAVISDDLKHDSAHASLAINRIQEYLKSMSLTYSVKLISIVSDGAASHFKNHYQLYEKGQSNCNKKWIFSATGHGKGAVDGVGGLGKHYATVHNLQSPETECIQDAQAFVKHVKKHTSSIQLIFLPKKDLDICRKAKIEEWNQAREYKGIQKCHMWKTDVNNQGRKSLIARTANHQWQEIKN